MTNELVVKSNFLVEAKYNIGLNEQRLVLCAISKIRKDQKFPEEVIITADDFARSFPEVKENARRELERAARRLWNSEITVKDPKRKRWFRWIQTRAEYYEGEARVALVFSQEIQNYLHELKTFFTKYPLKEISNLGSVYSIRMYELIQQFKALDERRIDLEEFREFFNLGDKYPLFKNLNRYLIKPAINELNKKSPLTISVDLERRLRKVIALQFTWKEKDS
jgi:plasmid replication initiation protein